MGGLEYDAYQGAKVIVLKSDAGLLNTSEWADRLITVINDWCGDISKQ